MPILRQNFIAFVCKFSWNFAAMVFDQSEVVAGSNMKTFRVAASCVVLAAFLALSISFKAEARVLLSQNNETPPADAGFSASPVAGIAPLAVGFRYRGTRQQPRIDFGDGSSSAMNAAPICAGCVPVYVASHTYVAAGAYTATLTADGRVAATTTITVAKP